MAKQQEPKTKTAASNFSLPVSSFEEIKRILQGYAARGDVKQLNEVSRATGVNADIITRNGAFMVETGLLTEGRTRGCTDLGRRLARAFEHKRVEEVGSGLREIVSQTPFLSDLPTAVRLKDGMTEDDLVGHILYSSNSPSNARKTAGAHAVVDLLREAGLLVEEGGKLQMAVGGFAGREDPSTPDRQPAATDRAPTAEAGPAERPNSPTPASAQAAMMGMGGQPVTIAINIQLHLPETDNPAVYENLFKALKANLLTPDANV